MDASNGRRKPVRLSARYGSARKGLSQTIGYRQAAPEINWSFHPYAYTAM